MVSSSRSRRRRRDSVMSRDFRALASSASGHSRCASHCLSAESRRIAWQQISSLSNSSGLSCALRAGRYDSSLNFEAEAAQRPDTYRPRPCGTGAPRGSNACWWRSAAARKLHSLGEPAPVRTGWAGSSPRAQADRQSPRSRPAAGRGARCRRRVCRLPESADNARLRPSTTNCVPCSRDAIVRCQLCGFLGAAVGGKAVDALELEGARARASVVRLASRHRAPRRPNAGPRHTCAGRASPAP